MPYQFEVLKNHVATVHPEIFDAFMEGWNNLGSQTQAHWRQQGLVAPKQKVAVKHWFSWTTIKTVELLASTENYSLDTPTSNFEKRLANLIHKKLQHSGQFFDIPSMPKKEN